MHPPFNVPSVLQVITDLCNGIIRHPLSAARAPRLVTAALLGHISDWWGRITYLLVVLVRRHQRATLGFYHRIHLTFRRAAAAHSLLRSGRVGNRRECALWHRWGVAPLHLTRCGRSVLWLLHSWLHLHRRH